MRKTCIFLVVTLIVSVMALPGFSYAKGKPVTPQRGPLQVLGKPSSTAVPTSEGKGPVVGQIKGKGWTKFVLEGTVVSEPDSNNIFKLKIKAGTVKRLKIRGFNVAEPVEIKVILTGDHPTKFRPKNKGIDYLKKDVRVNVKGNIVKSDNVWTLEATRIVIKPERKVDTD